MKKLSLLMLIGAMSAFAQAQTVTQPTEQTAHEQYIDQQEIEHVHLVDENSEEQSPEVSAPPQEDILLNQALEGLDPEGL